MEDESISREAFEAAAQEQALPIARSGMGYTDDRTDACWDMWQELWPSMRDAARYRWLRQYWVDSYLAVGNLEKLDGEIDTAMAKRRQVAAPGKA